MSTGWMSQWWGPVFDAERKTRARRWQGYALRALFVLGLLTGLTLAWLNQRSQTGPVSVQRMAQMGSSAFYTITLLQLVAVLLVAPAATAGAICLDKARGSLAHVFVTDLTNREIILGKLAARLLPVWGLLACALPVSAMATWLGGIDPIALTGAFLIAGGVALLGCSFALMLSVWASKPQDVLTVIFGVWALWLLACPVYQIVSSSNRSPLWLERTNPLYLTSDPYIYPGETTLLEQILFALGCGMIGAGFVAVAVAKVRVVGCRSARLAARRVGRIGRSWAWVRGQVRWGRGPALDANPVLWREWHRNRPSRWSRGVWVGFDLISALVGVGLIVDFVLGSMVLVDVEVIGVAIGLLATIGLLLISTSVASVLAEERARGSLDVLMSTPVSTRAILRAKWWGAFRRVPWLAAWPTLVGMVYLTRGRPDFVRLGTFYLVPVLIVVQGAALVSLGLALATWIKRPGQATARTISGLVASVVGWLIIGCYLPLADWAGLQESDGIRYHALDWGLSMGSPACNVMISFLIATTDISFDRGECEAFLILTVGWIMIYGLAAILLFEATVRTFDRCLGRTSDRPSTPRLEPVRGPRSRPFRFKGWSWKAPARAGRPMTRAASFEGPPR